MQYGKGHTNLRLIHKKGMLKTNNMNINNGIFQRDSFSPPMKRVIQAIQKRRENESFRTSIALLRSLSAKYPWERYEPPYPPSYGGNSTTVHLEGLI